MKELTAACALCFFVGCATETDTTRSIQDAEPLRLHAQSVTATVKRQATTLVHIETAHGTLITTPEHPFATPQPGWISAGQLAPGDRVMSAKFGELRVLSKYDEKPLRPVAVFNLSVSRSHAYFVGTDQVLVHNTKCADKHAAAPKEDTITRLTRQLGEKEHEIEVLKSAPNTPENQERLKTLKAERQTIKNRIDNFNSRERKRRQGGNEPHEGGSKERKRRQGGNEPNEGGSKRGRVADEDTLPRAIRELAETEDEIAALKSTPNTPENQERLETLKKQRTAIKKRINSYNFRTRLSGGESAQTVDKRKRLESARASRLERDKARYESTQRELEQLRSQLRANELEQPRSEAEQKAHAARKAELEKKIETSDSELKRQHQILIWENQLAELETRSSVAEGESSQIENAKAALRANIETERKRMLERLNKRKRAADPERQSAFNAGRQQERDKRLRTKRYLEDPTRPRDALELFEEELAAARQEPASDNRELRIASLTERIDILNSLVNLNRKEDNDRKTRYKARKKRKELLDRKESTQKIDEKIAEMEQTRVQATNARNELRARALLLGIQGVRGRKAPRAADETQLRETERWLEAELAHPSTIDEARLTEMERAFAEVLHDHPDALDAAFFEEIWAEAGDNEPVDAELLAMAEELLPQLSREQETDVGPILQAMENELRQERRSVDAADFELANQHAAVSATLPPPGARGHDEGVQRLAELQRQRMELRTEWKQRMQRRLQDAQQQLRVMQGVERARPDPAETRLALQIALLEHELQNPL